MNVSPTEWISPELFFFNVYFGNNINGISVHKSWSVWTKKRSALLQRFRLPHFSQLMIQFTFEYATLFLSEGCKRVHEPFNGRCSSSPMDLSSTRDATITLLSLRHYILSLMCQWSIWLSPSNRNTASLLCGKKKTGGTYPGGHCTDDQLAVYLL